MNDFSTWMNRNILITVKAYPQPSQKHSEIVCVAGITKEEGWIRLYPVNYRDLEKGLQFKKYDIVQMKIKKTLGEDTRPESFSPQLESLKIVSSLHPTSGDWKEREGWIKPTLCKSMCDLQKLQATNKKSLGCFKVNEVLDINVEKAATIEKEYPTQLTFWNPGKKKLEIIPYKFRLNYKCADANCRTHAQEILDWEIGELFRKMREEHGEQRALEKVKEKLTEITDTKKKDVIIFAGNHSRYPNAFMILGFFYPRKQKQLKFDF